MKKTLLGLYTLFLIYIGYVYIDWTTLSIYGFTKGILLLMVFSIEYIINFNIYRRFIRENIDSAYDIAVKTITAIYGLIMVGMFIFMPIHWGIDNLTIIFALTLIYITIVMSLLHYGIRRERNLNP